MYRMTQAKKMSGFSICGSDMVYSPRDAAESIFGENENDVRGNMVMYLFRRFGYPIYGWDDHKSVISYYLTTPDPEIILWVDPKSNLAYSFGYGKSPVLEEESNVRLYEYRKTGGDWYGQWESSPLYQRIDTSIKAAIKNLLRPTNIRDVEYTILGEYTGKPSMPFVKPSVQAGYGVGKFNPVKESERE